MDGVDGKVDGKEGGRQGDDPPRDEIDFTDMLMDEFLKKSGLIFQEASIDGPSGRDVLSPHYKPGNPLHRDKQIHQLLEFLKPVFNDGTPSNLLIYGKTGTGKTLITRHVTAKIQEKGKAGSFKVPRFAYINVQMYNTKYRVLSKICEDTGIPVPKTGLATDHLLELLRQRLKADGRSLVVVIDEVDLLVKSREKDDLLYLLTRLAEEDPSLKVSTIGISNDLRFKTFLGIRVLSSLNPREIVFPPYTKRELEAILTERARLAFKDGTCTGDIISALATLAAKEHGDARKAIALLLKTADIAEREGSPFVDADHLVKAVNEHEFDTIANFLATLPVQYQIVLIGLSNARLYCKCNLNTGMILNLFHELVTASDTFTSPIGLRRILQILNDLQGHGVVDLQLTSDGRRGRYNIASINVERPVIEQVFSKNPTLKKLLNYVPKVRCLESFLI